MPNALRAAAAALLLTACAPAAAPPAAAPAGVEVTVQAEAAEAYNIVWLRANVRNTGQQPRWVVAQPDSVDASCALPGGLGLVGFTPGQDTLSFCQTCTVGPRRAPRYVALAPGAARTVRLKVNFNYVLPRRVLDSLRTPCYAYANRTTGPYRLQVVYQAARAGRRGAVPTTRGNSVTVYRKK